MIARRNALRLAGELDIEAAAKLNLLLVARDDPSEHVRQQLSKCLAKLRDAPAIQALSRQCLEDPSPRVRAVALRELARTALDEGQTTAVVVRTLRDALRASAHSLDVRMGVEAVELVCCGPFASVPALEFAAELAVLVHRESLAPELRDLAASTLRRLEESKRARQ